MQQAIIVNDKKELLLGFSYNDYQFPGGHLEKDEEPVKGLIRELKEETGIDIEKQL
jgi:8-oxo-dGTP diphosphatase